MFIQICADVNRAAVINVGVSVSLGDPVITVIDMIADAPWVFAGLQRHGDKRVAQAVQVQRFGQAGLAHTGLNPVGQLVRVNEIERLVIGERIEEPCDIGSDAVRDRDPAAAAARVLDVRHVETVAIKVDILAGERHELRAAKTGREVDVDQPLVGLVKCIDMVAAFRLPCFDSFEKRIKMFRRQMAFGCRLGEGAELTERITVEHLVIDVPLPGGA